MEEINSILQIIIKLNQKKKNPKPGKQGIKNKPKNRLPFLP